MGRFTGKELVSRCGARVGTWRFGDITGWSGHVRRGGPSCPASEGGTGCHGISESCSICRDCGVGPGKQNRRS